MLSRIHHVAIAVADLDAAIELTTRVWGLRLEHREVVEDQDVEEAMLRVGDGYLQLVAARSPASTVARFLARGGEGVHHVAYEVPDVAAELRRMAAEGARLIDEHPRPGSRGTRVAFVHPRGNLGVLVELVQLPGPGPVDNGAIVS